MKNFKILFFIIFINLSTLCYTQDTLQFSHKNIGFGAALNEDRFYFPIFLGGCVKIEPEFILDWTKDNDRHRFEEKSFEIGSGIFYTLNYKRLIPYFGLRIGYSNREYSYSDGEGLNESGFFISPTIGGEYFLVDKFSFGVELLSRYSHIDGTSKTLSGDEDIDRQGFWTYTYFIMRVYLF